jgi:hypothetical protein
MHDTLWDDLEILIPRLLVKIKNELPEEFHDILTDYTLLVVIHSTYSCLTPQAKLQIRKMVYMWKCDPRMIGVRMTK